MKKILNICVIVLYVVLLGYFSFTFFRWSDTGYWDFSRPYKILIEGEQSLTGVNGVVYYHTGAININKSFSWNPSISVEKNIDNVFLSGEENIDYIKIKPEPQPDINKETSSGNNSLIRSYNSKYICEFTIPKNKLAGYLLVTLTSGAKIDIEKGRGIYLAIQGTTIGMITSNFIPYGENQYLYDITNLTFNTSKYKRNLFDKIVDSKLEISACVVSDKQNIKIEKLTLILYNPVAYSEE